MSDLAPWSPETERLILAEACHRRFWHFLNWAFGAGLEDNPDAGWLNEYHRKLSDDLLQPEFERWQASRGTQEPYDAHLLIVSHRDSGKTVTVTKAFPMWAHLRNPNLAVVIDSEKQTKSQDFAGVCRKIYEGRSKHSLFAWLYGIWAQDEEWTKAAFTHRVRDVVLSEPSFACSSIEVGTTGYHPHLHVTDDPVVWEQIKDTGKAIDEANRHMDAIIPAMKSPVFQILVGTPYQEGDPITRAEREGIRRVVGLEPPPEVARHIRDDGKWTLFWLPARDKRGRITVPALNGESKLNGLQEHRNAFYQSQYALLPSAGEHVPLTWNQLEDMLIDSKEVPFGHLAYTIHMDTAFKTKDRIARGCESVIQVWGHHPTNGDVYFIEGYGSKLWRNEEFGDKLVQVVQDLYDKRRIVRCMTDEKTMGGKEGTWRSLLLSFFRAAGMRMPPFLEFNRQGTRKHLRIVQAAGFWIDGHVHLVRRAPGVNQLIEQMARIGISELRDWADAAADVFHPDVYRVLAPAGEAQPQPRITPQPQPMVFNAVARPPIR